MAVKGLGGAEAYLIYHSLSTYWSKTVCISATVAATLHLGINGATWRLTEAGEGLIGADWG